jgi:hypothetical protein
MSNPFTLPRYEDAVKRMLIASYLNEFYQKLSPDELVDTLNRIFKHKAKVIRNLALYVQKEVEEKGRPAEKIVRSLNFYAVILKEFSAKALGQPLKR